MPEIVHEPVLHYADGHMWIEHERREKPMYREQVDGRVEELRREHPNGDYPTASLEHEPSECIECDALRELELLEG